MGQETAEIKRSVLSFINGIKEWKIEKVIIFGSRIRGNHLKNSDLDLILISEDFKGLSLTDRIGKISQYYNHWKADFSLELLCYTPEEFEKKRKQIGMVKEAVEQGITINI